MIEVRRYQASNFLEVTAFLRAVQALDPDFDAPEDAAFASFINQSVNRGGRDFRLAYFGDRLVGALFSGRYRVLDRAHWVRGFRIIVNPQGRVLGAADLLHNVLNTQDEDSKLIHRTVLAGEQSCDSDLLNERGFELVQRIKIMRRIGPPPPLTKLPATFSIRDADIEQDASFITRLSNVANRRTFGFAPLVESELEETVDAPGGRLLVLETDQGRVVGSAQTLPFFDNIGVLHSVYVDPQYQGLGLGRFLVLTALNVLAQHGFRCVELSVDEKNLAANNLYSTLNFEVYRIDETFERIRG